MNFRDIPLWERQRVANAIHSLLHCEFDQVPLEMLISQFFRQFYEYQINVQDFTRCLHDNKIEASSCHKASHLRAHCDKRFNLSPAKTKRCANMTLESKLVKKYKQCVLKTYERAQPCLRHLQERCERASVRGIKTVRATMSEVELLLQQDPDLKVLHLFRDPRAVLLSRLNHESFRSAHSRKNPSIEARFYCNIVEADRHLKQSLANTHPDSFREIIYEKFLASPIAEAEEIYEFLGIEMPQEIFSWLEKDAKRVKTTFLSKFNATTLTSIEDTCESLFDHAGENWVYPPEPDEKEVP